MEDVQRILQQYWGYDSFRPLQQEIIEAVLAGHDTLAVMPTGGGKSLCFQVPALAGEGLCLVVSPLIALMKDQVDGLKKRNIPALLIHSGMQRADVVQTLKNATHNYFKFLYVSPERLETRLFQEYLPAIDISLIAVDEAHCISQWGYDFRPSYLRIAELRKELPGVPVLALTASATEAVQADIRERLTPELPKKKTPWQTFRQPFDRPNLSYSAFQVDAKMARLVEIVQKVPGTGIVYCKSRKRTTEIARLLQLHGIAATAYHAGLKTEERSERQQQWLTGKVRVMACTNAFGMGIDKGDVRLVVHVDSPDCLENYYQEAGRAGRDGKKAYAVLLHNARDREELALLHHTRFPALDFIKKVYGALVNFLAIPVNSGQGRSFVFRFEAFVRNFSLPPTETLHALKALEGDGWFDFNEKNFTPSTLVFQTGKQSLYAFYQSHPEHEELLTILLRTYGGIFDFPAFVSETVLARLARKEEAEIRGQLQTITAFGVIRYTPRNDEPQIIFRKQRVAAEDLSFNLMQYYKRRDAFVARTNNMIAYIESKSCRSKTIGSYFGDAAAKDCGVCDNCLAKKKRELTPAEFDRIAQQVITLLSAAPMPVEKLLDQLLPVGKEKCWEVIRFLQAEKKIKVGKDNLLLLR